MSERACVSVSERVCVSECVCVYESENVSVCVCLIFSCGSMISFQSVRSSSAQQMAAHPHTHTHTD